MPISRYYFLFLIGIFVYLLFPSRGANTNRAAAGDMPGVGISLTVDYAVLSLRREGGSFENVGRVQGSDEYVKMMQRLSTPEAQHAR